MKVRDVLSGGDFKLANAGRNDKLCCVGGTERPHVWDVVSEGQRNSNGAREKGMGLMVQGL